MTFVIKNKLVAALFAAVLATPALAADEPTLPPSENSTPSAGSHIFGVAGDGGDINYQAVDFSNHTPAHAAVRSAVVPGWGQGFNRQTTKGVLLFLTTVGATVGSVRLYRTAQRTYGNYEDQGSKDGPLYEDYTRQRTQALALGLLAVSLYSFSIYDAYKNAYNPLWSRSNSVDLSLASDGGTLWWRKYF